MASNSTQASTAPVKKQPENTVKMFGYYVPYWLVLVILVLVLALLHRMSVVNMSCLVPTCFLPGSRIVLAQGGGAMIDSLTSPAALLPNVTSM